VAGLLGVIGFLVVCAGLHLLWLSRVQVAFWFGRYFKMFRALLRDPSARSESVPKTNRPENREGTVQMVLGMSLVFFVGPLLLALSFTLLFFYPNL
jgi:hypothetical protein